MTLLYDVMGEALFSADLSGSTGKFRPIPNLAVSGSFKIKDGDLSLQGTASTNIAKRGEVFVSGSVRFDIDEAQFEELQLVFGALGGINESDRSVGLAANVGAQTSFFYIVTEQSDGTLM